MTDRIDEMNRDEEFEKWFAESVYSTELKMPLRRAWHAALKARPEARTQERLLDDRRMLIDCLANFTVASDRFVADTGLKHGDLITDAAEVARSLVQKLREHHYDGTPMNSERKE